MKHQNPVTIFLVALLVSVLSWAPALSHAQEQEPESPTGEFRLAVPLLEGHQAPFSGILLSEDDFRLALELDAAAERWEAEARVYQRQLETERSLYEEFISEQRDRINELSQQDWWDENGTWFMFGVGAVLGIVVSVVLVALANG